jgi:hypothetical protein
LTSFIESKNKKNRANIEEHHVLFLKQSKTAETSKNKTKKKQVKQVHVAKVVSFTIHS